MKFSKKLGMFLLSLTAVTVIGAGVVNAKTEAKSVDIMFTSDVHSHLDSFTTLFEGKETDIGGFARIKTLITKQKEENPDTLVVDGGDFSMGTLVQTVYEEQAAELRTLGAVGCDATTLGNHEFDYRSEGLINMLNTAADSGDEVPSLVVCNVDWSDMNDTQAEIKEAFDNYGVKPYIMVKKGDVNIAIIGVFGNDALACAPTCQLKFSDPIQSVKDTVADIQENEDADMIICLSHCGVTDNAKTSEDENLAKEVPELDLIVSGHSHVTLKTPIVYDNTYIASCGEYGEQLGSMTMTQKDDGRWKMESYDMIPVTSEIESDEDTQNLINAFEASVDEIYLSQFGYTHDQLLAENDVEFSSVNDLYYVHEEQNLGSIIADSYLYAARNAEPDTVFDIAVVPSGTIRDTYTTGDITVTDVFNSFSLGIGPDGVPGYPLIKVYMTGKELKTAAEIDASVSDYMNSARLFMSGLNFTFNPNRMILNKVTDIAYVNANGETEELDDDKLYCVVADLYSGQMLSSVTDMSYGILSFVPKDENGTPITDFEDAIIYDGSKELKAWVAIAEYMQSFEKNEYGVSVVPASYGEGQGRKVVDDSKNIAKLIKNPNKYVAMIIGIILVLIVILVLIIRLIIRIVRKCKKKRIEKK